jgi:rhodanese-related sulfurtransferase
MARSNVLLVSPGEAMGLLQRGYTYVDVRSEVEFALGRPQRSLNVPWQCVDGDRLVDNPEFVEVMRAVFRTSDPLLIGCRSGNRSEAAVAVLRDHGFEHLAELLHGFEGARDDFGRRVPGWRQSGLPCEWGAPDREQTYVVLRGRAFGTDG